MSMCFMLRCSMDKSWSDESWSDETWIDMISHGATEEDFKSGIKLELQWENRSRTKKWL